MPSLRANYQNGTAHVSHILTLEVLCRTFWSLTRNIWAQIVGKNKSYIMSLLLNVQKVKEAWLALDREYGNLDPSQLGMLAELSKLCEREPADELAENKNIVKVLGFYNIARHHKKHRELISRHFFTNM